LTSMDILDKARRLEFTLARSLDDAARRFVRSGERQPLEIVHAIVHAVEARLEPAGRGRHVFPFNRIEVAVRAETRETRSRLEAVFNGTPALERRILERLQAAGCEPDGLQVTTSFVPHSEPHWSAPEFHIVFDRVQAPLAAAPEEQSQPEH
jgi:hypothetical protein